MTEIKQFKLTTGEEIVCDVVEWPDEDGESPDLVVRNAFKIVAHTETEDNVRIYALRPWMILQEGNDVYQTLNIGHVVGEANPTQKMLEQYTKVLQISIGASEENTADDFLNKLRSYMESVKKTLDSENKNDSDGGNIISFPGKTLH